MKSKFIYTTFFTILSVCALLFATSGCSSGSGLPTFTTPGQQVSELALSNEYSELRSEYSVMRSKWDNVKDKYPSDTRYKIDLAITKASIFFSSVNSGNYAIISAKFNDARLVFNEAYYSIMSNKAIPIEGRRTSRALKLKVDRLSKNMQGLSNASSVKAMLEIVTPMVQTLLL